MQTSNLLRAMFSASIAIGFFAMAEVGLMLLGEEWSALYDGDPGYDWRLKPNLDVPNVPHLEEENSFSVKTNAAGFRDDPIPDSGPWVLAMGCSTTFGWGVEHEEVWTELLEESLGVSVVNAGVPGHSSHQGKGVAQGLLKRRPTAVILGWGLRDAQRTTVPDSIRKPAAFPRNTRLYRKLVSAVATPTQGTLPRVSVTEFEENLKSIAELATEQGIGVLLLDMTTRSDTPSHGSVLPTLELPLVVPQLGEEHYFPADPIHLNQAGNQRLAQQLETPLMGLLQPATAPLPLEPVPAQTP